MKRILIVALALAAGTLACGSDANSDGSGSSTTTGGGNAACGDMSGTWKISGSCGSDTCVITQSACTTSLKCSNGSASYTGSLADSDVTYSGTSGSGVPATCHGTLSGSSITGTCTPTGGAACTFSAAKN